VHRAHATHQNDHLDALNTLMSKSRLIRQLSAAQTRQQVEKKRQKREKKMFFLVSFSRSSRLTTV
jgi:hypothetical protein